MLSEIRCIIHNKKNGFLNMAIDEAILSGRKPTIRFYQWKPMAVSIGYMQKIDGSINIHYLHEQNITLVRRITGGRAVFHHRELTYSIVVPQDEIGGTFLEVYSRISTAIIKTLQALGIEARLKNERPGAGNTANQHPAANCFAEPGLYEIVCNNKKIVGSAQRRINGMILQQGSILLDFDMKKTALCFPPGPGSGMQNDLLQRITSIRMESGKKIKPLVLAQMLRNQFENDFSMKIIDACLSAEEKRMAKKLAEEKYAADEWNLSAIGR